MDNQSAFVPYPTKLAFRDGMHRLDRALDIIALGPARPAAEYLGALLERGAGIAVRYIFPDSADVELNGSGQGAASVIRRIRFGLPESATDSAPETEDEGYRITIGSGEILITAGSPRGFFWGTQTIRQLLPHSLDGEGGTELSAVSLPGLEIVDRPKFAWRGLQFDVSRHFYPVSFIKKIIDLLAYYKLNVFHWHLTDDQGWRIEIKRYPELTDVGGRRREPDGTRQGGFYTQDEIREVVAYAARRQVSVVPEIEMPGHARAAVAAFPWLSCTKEPIDVWNHGGISKDLFCAGREQTFAFLQNVLDEVAELFPSELVHIGGDECPKDRWKVCPDCQARIREEGLQDEEALQGYFVRRIQSYLSRLGKKVVGWDEILEGGLAPGATVMSWRGIKGGVAAVKAGRQAVMSPTSHCYFDYRQSANLGELGPTQFDPPITTLRHVYSFEPIPKGLEEEQRRNIVGSEGNVWTEEIDSEERAGYMIFPRLCALAEVLWSPPDTRDWEAFKRRLAANIKRLDVVGMEYCRILESVE